MAGRGGRGWFEGEVKGWLVGEVRVGWEGRYGWLGGAVEVGWGER